MDILTGVNIVIETDFFYSPKNDIWDYKWHILTEKL